MLELNPGIIVSSLPLLAKGMLITLQITLCGIVLGITLGTLLALASLSRFRILQALAKVYTTCFRAVPLLMVLLWFYLLVPQFLSRLFDLSADTDIRLISAIVAFSMFEAAYYTEIIRAGIKSIPPGQGQAARALGMSRWQMYRLVILPQAFLAMLPLLLTQAIILFQDTSLVYILGLADFFRTASNIGKSTGYEIQMVLFAGLVYLVICAAASFMVKYFQKKIAR